MFQESDDSLKDRMISIESEIRTLRQKLSNKRDDKSDDDVDKTSSVDQTNAPTKSHDTSPTSLEITRNGESEASNSCDVMSTNDLSENERRSLRRTRLHPRRFRQVNPSQDIEEDLDMKQADQPEENSN